MGYEKRKDFLCDERRVGLSSKTKKRFLLRYLETSKSNIAKSQVFIYASIEYGNLKFDSLVKSQKLPVFVIPANAGIQGNQSLLDSRFRGSDGLGDFLRTYQIWLKCFLHLPLILVPFGLGSRSKPITQVLCKCHKLIHI